MQPYRTAKPHAGTECRQCAPTAAGHHLCQADGCDGLAARQTLRHATEAEYTALPANLRPTDGIAHQIVFGCDDCTENGEFDPFCTHTIEPVPCPRCLAVGEQPCTRKNGTARRDPHRARADADAQQLLEPCLHAHRGECDVFTGCQCTSQDPTPTRSARIVASGHEPDISGLTMPPLVAQMLLARAGHRWDRIVRAWNQLTQTNQPALGAEYEVYDETGNLTRNAHGHPITDTVIITLTPASARELAP